MNDPLTEVKFWALVMANSHQTVLCSPELESRCKGYVDARGLGHLIKVEASRYVPDDKLFVIDDTACAAELNRSLQQETRRLF